MRSLALLSPVPGLAGYYVSIAGVVFSVRSGRLKRLRTSQNNHGYQYIDTSIGGSRARHSVHVLVARAYHGEPPSARHEVRHLDGDNQHNVARNLAWGTRRENVADTLRHGRHPSQAHRECYLRGDQHPNRRRPERLARGERHYAAKLTTAKVIEYRRRRRNGEPLAALAREAGVTRFALRNAITGRKWAHVPAKEE